MTPAWVLDIFVAVGLVVAALSMGRIAAARPWRRETVVTEADFAYPLMGLAMAGTLAAGLRILPDNVWDVIFAAMTAWFAYRVSGTHARAAPAPWQTRSAPRNGCTARRFCTCSSPSVRPPPSAARSRAR